jgi:hypothetical protein
MKQQAYAFMIWLLVAGTVLEWVLGQIFPRRRVAR